MRATYTDGTRQQPLPVPQTSTQNTTTAGRQPALAQQNDPAGSRQAAPSFTRRPEMGASVGSATIRLLACNPAIKHNRALPAKRVSRRHTAVKVLCATALLAAVSLTGCRPGNKGATAAGGPGAPGAKPTASLATQVSVTPVRAGSISKTQPVTGALSAQNDVTVGAKLAGRLAAVYLREGDPVRQGQVVAQQDPADLQAQLDQQRANLAGAQTRLEQSRVTLQNAKTTLQLTDQQTRSAVAEAQAALDAAKQQLAVVQRGARTQERQQAGQAVAVAQANRASNQADLVSAQADAARAQADLRRYQSLYTQSAIPAQQLDQARATADSAAARVDAARARVAAGDAAIRSAQESLSLIQEGSRTEDIRRAQANVEQARQALVTAQANRSQVNLRRADVNSAQAGIANAQASVTQAQAAVRLAQQGVADTAIRAPISGVVAERRAEPGQQMGAGKDIMRIVALDSIYFDAQLPEALFAQVGVGKTVNVQVSAFPSRTFRGTIYKVFPVASSAARNFTVRVALFNEGNTLRPQMFARGEIVLATHPNALLVPRDAVLDNTGTQGRVFLAQSKTAKEQQVKVGFANQTDTELTSGVQQGDQVVTQGQAQLQDGAAIQIITPATQSASAKP